MAFQIGYKNLLSDAAATVTATSETTGFEIENGYDGFSYDWWKPIIQNVYVQIDFADFDSRAADYIAFWGHNLGTHNARIVVQYWNGSIYVNAITPFLVDSDNTIYQSFTSVEGTKWRIYVQVSSNLVLWSEDFSNPVWVGTGSGFVTSNAALAPDGTLTADRLSDTDATINQYYLNQITTIPDDTGTYNFSVFLKQNTAAVTTIAGYCVGGTNVSSLVTVTWADHSVSAGTISDEGDGWYRVSGTITNNGTGNTSLYTRIFPAGTAVSTTGSVFAWGSSSTVGSTLYGYQKTESVTNISTPSIAGIQLGETLELPHNAEVGFAVPTLAPKIELKTARSESGGFIGGRQLSKGVEGSINFTNIDPAWVRTYWKPFLDHVQTPKTFVMAWDTTTYTDEIVHAWASGNVDKPNYSSPLFMNFSLNYEGNL